MSFTLFTFLFIFAVAGIFFITPGKFRKYILLLASILYVLKYNTRSCAWMVLTSVVVYLTGLLLHKLVRADRRPVAKAILVFVSSLCIALFAAFKYSELIPVGDDVVDFFIIPIGFSYYIFQAISYLFDIYSQKIDPEKNIADFMLYMCFFPKFLSGPIERPNKFLKQIDKLSEIKLLDYDRISSSLLYILYGFLLKVTIADRLGLYTAKIMQAPETFGSLALFIGMLAYTIQIYCDFFGYTTVARGVGRIFGIDLTRNFNAPYLAKNISDFWRRWHMSLSFWIRDYVYIPLGGNRKGFGIKCFNLMIVFFLCGLWHGCGLHYVLWGILHGILSVIYATFKRRKRKPQFPRTTEIHLTFLCVSFAWLFFGISDLRILGTYITRLVTFTKGQGSFLEQLFSLGIKGSDKILIPLIALVIFMDILSVRLRKPPVDALRSINYIFRYVLIYFMVIALLLFGIYGPGYNSADFMYMNY